MRFWLMCGLGLAMIGVAFATSTDATAAASAPCPNCNVVWVTMDTTRADRMGFLGNTSKLTPNIDRHAAASRVFPNAYSHAPETLQSVSAFFSGRYRANNGMDFDLAETTRYHALSPEVTTIAEAFAKAGYATVGFNANPVIAQGKGYSFGLDQGFQRWDHGDDAAMTAAAVQYLGATTDKPAFVYVQLMGPHADNPRLEGFETRRGKHTTVLGTVTQKYYEDVAAGRITASEADFAYMRAMYDDAVWEMDQRVGAIFDAARAGKHGSNTIIVLDADHGEALGEPGLKYPRFGHGHALNAELLRVPLVIGGTGVGAGPDPRVAELVDVAPTLTGLVGIATDPSWKWDGQPLTGTGAVAGTTAISERGTWEGRQIGGRTTTAAYLLSPAKGWVKAYDLRTDPFQLALLTPESALSDEQKALKALIDAYLKNANPPGVSGAKTSATDAELELLKALGYTQ